MSEQLLHALTLCETDLEGAMRRFSDDEAFYIACLKAFLEDETLNELNASLEAREWDDAFTAAHALKGLAGNMGFVPLFHATGELVLMIRAGRVNEIPKAQKRITSCYDDIVSAIRHNADV